MGSSIDFELEKKKKEIQDVIDKEKKHFNQELEKIIKQKLSGKNKKKFLKLEKLIKEEEKLFENNLLTIIEEDSTDSSGKGFFFCDKKFIETLKLDIFERIESFGIKLIEEEKVLFEKVESSLKEDLIKSIAQVEDNLKSHITHTFQNIQTIVDKKETATAITSNLSTDPPKKDLPTASKTDNLSLFKPVNIKENQVEAASSSSFKEKNSKKIKTLKELYSVADKKIPFWGKDSTNIVGTFTIRPASKPSRGQNSSEPKSLFGNLFLSNTSLQKKRDK